MRDELIAEHDSFADFRHAISRIRLRNQAAAFVAVLGVSFVSDFFALGHTPEFATISVGLPLQIAICVVAYVLLEYTIVGRTYPVTLSGAGYWAICALGGWVLGTLGGFDGPYFYTVYVLPSFVLTVPLPLRPRIAVTLGMVAMFLLAFLIPHPEYLEFPRVNIAFNALAGITIINIFVGHRAYSLNEQTFTLAKERDRALARAEERGGQLRKHLEAQAARVRALADDAEQARSSERAELARTLHDDVGQLLLSARLQLASVDRRLDEALESEEALGALNGLLANLEGNMRGLIGNLRVEATPDEKALADSVESLVSVARDDAGLDIVLDTLPHDEVPVRLRAVLARLVQEGLKNVVKHAQASRVEVRVRREVGWLVATVVDDGVGVDPANVEEADGWGVVGLRERVERLGGFVELRPRGAHGEGSILEARLPWAEVGVSRADVARESESELSRLRAEFVAEPDAESRIAESFSEALEPA